MLQQSDSQRATLGGDCGLRMVLHNLTCTYVVQLPVEIPSVLHRRQAKCWPYSKATFVVATLEKPLCETENE